MLSNLFSSVLTNSTTSLDAGAVLLCTAVSLVLGLFIAWIFTIHNRYSKSFVVTLALLPAIVQMVILLVNGNLGTGVAVMGTFSLVRFRSAPGTAREITSLFLAMAVGLATGTGCLGIAALFALIMGGVMLLYNRSSFGEQQKNHRVLHITIPESLNYTNAFDDLFNRYTTKTELAKVHTANMGSLYKLEYQVELKNLSQEKEFLDELRCRNGNLEISCGRMDFGIEEL